MISDQKNHMQWFLPSMLGHVDKLEWLKTWCDWWEEGSVGMQCLAAATWCDWRGEGIMLGGHRQLQILSEHRHLSPDHRPEVYVDLYPDWPYQRRLTWAGLCRTGIFQPRLYVLYKSKVNAVCASGQFLRSSRSPLDAPPELSASKVLQTSLGPYWTLSEIKGIVLRWGAQHMSWGQSPSESVILTPLRDCMHPCAWSLTMTIYISHQTSGTYRCQCSLLVGNPIQASLSKFWDIEQCRCSAREHSIDGHGRAHKL
jgi:hypothetical protein